MADEKPTAEGKDPEELLRAILRVSPEDAAKVREVADTKADEPDG